MTEKGLLERIRKHKLFQGLPDDDLSKLLDNSEWVYFPQGKEIFEAGRPAQYVYIVCYGAVKLVQSRPSGEEVILHFIPAGGLVAGVVAMQPDGRYPLTAITLEESGFIKTTGSCFRDMVSSRSKLSAELLRMVSLRMSDLHGEKLIKKGTVPQKIADFLLRQLDRQGQEMGTKIMMRLTRQDIANAVGTTVETVIRVFSQWTQDGVILTEDHHIEIKNRSALQKIIKGE